MKRLVFGAALAFVAVLAWSSQTTSTQTMRNTASSATAVTAADAANASLTGVVSSAEEGKMEGVLVSAKAAGSTIRTTVVSDSQGVYAFPKSRLGAGKYEVTIRAVGYTAADPGDVVVADSKPTQLNLTLTKVRDINSQLTNAERMMTLEQKFTRAELEPLLGCINCHTLEPILNNPNNEEEWIGVLKRMANQPRNAAPEARVTVPGQAEASAKLPSERFRDMAQLLVKLNSPEARALPAKTLPRPKGAGTKVVVTEYTLPRANAQPHDSVPDKEGNIWYFDFAYPILGKLNPKTGEVKEYTWQKARPNHPGGANGVSIDRDGNIWSGQMHQTGALKFDRKTETFTFFQPDPGMYNNDQHSRTAHIDLNYFKDGNRDKLVIWLANQPLLTAHMLDTDTGKMTNVELYKHLPPGKNDPVGDDVVNRRAGHSIYGITVDSNGNGWGADQSGGNLARIDRVTQKVTLIPIPTKGGGPKRLHTDANDVITYADEAGETIGLYDIKTGTFKSWPVPTPYSQPYDAVSDKHGNIWNGGVTKDQIVKFNTKTGTFVEYLMPAEMNVRRVAVDDATTPSTFWVGNNHSATIMRVEPIE